MTKPQRLKVGTVVAIRDDEGHAGFGLIEGFDPNDDDLPYYVRHADGSRACVNLGVTGWHPAHTVIVISVDRDGYPVSPKPES